MSRTTRPHMPGVLFHVTSRLQGRVPHCVGLEPAIASIIQDALTYTDVRLLAYTIMPNHLHFVVQQGRRPLSSYMQPLLRRVALLLQRQRGCEGHVVERRYRERACVTAEYARNALAYVHLNAVRKALVQRPDEYSWCSYRDFCAATAAHPRSQLCVEDALRLFSSKDGDSIEACARNYRRFIRWRLAMDRWLDQAEGAGFHAPTPIWFPGGDEHWCTTYAPFIQQEVEGRRVERRRMDLRDLVVVALRQVSAELTLDDLRGRSCSRPVVAARREVIVRASSAGYTGKSIATFLRVSQATVSAAIRSDW